MAEKNVSPDLSGYWAIIYEKRRIALAVGLIVLSLIVWGGYLWPKTYEADSTIFIQSGGLAQPFMGTSGLSGTIEDELRVLKKSVTSRNIVDRVLKQLNMDVAAKNAGQYDALVSAVREGIGVEISKQGNAVDLFTVSYESGDPKRAQEIVNSLVNMFIEESLASLRASASAAYAFLNNQLDVYKQKLNGSDQAIVEFKREHPELVFQSGTPADIYAMQSATTLHNAQVAKQMELSSLLNLRNDLLLELAGKKELNPYPDRPGSPQDQLNKLNFHLLELSTKYTDSYPEVFQTRSEIAALKAKMEGKIPPAENPVYQQVKQELHQTNAKIDALRKAIDQMYQQQRSATVASADPAVLAQWDELVRNRKGYQDIYNSLLVRCASAKAAMDQAEGPGQVLKVVDPAVLPVIPVKPNMVKVILIGLILGLLCGIGAALALNHLENSYYSEKDVETGLKLPVLISIPRMATEEEKAAVAKEDRKMFMAAGVYVLFICVLLAREFLFRQTGIRIGPF